MAARKIPDLTEAEQRVVLRLWAASAAVAEAMPAERRALVQGLERVLAAAAKLPPAIGFGPAPAPSTIKTVSREERAQVADELAVPSPATRPRLS
jgi:hypothetical protein